ncbi:hypothetical protein JCM10213_008742 [Rhodosporidiobolus nylandii]
MAYLAAISRSSSQKTYSTPYDDVDDLPNYPASHGDGRSLRGQEHEGDQASLLSKEGKQGGGGPLTVDQYLYEIGRLHHDLTTLRSNLAGIPSLVQDAAALAPTDNSLVAQSLLQDLSAQTTASADLLAYLPDELGSLASKSKLLKPAAGNFVVSSAEQRQVKQELTACAGLLKASIRDIETGARNELEGTQQARMRLLKVIKAAAGEAGEAEQMGHLLTAEREGAGLVERLKPGSYGWRWAVEHPYSRLQASLASFGTLSFLDSIQAPVGPAPSLWANPLSYVPSLSFSAKPPRYAAPGETPTAVDGSQEEEGKIGNYGEPIEGPPKPPQRWKVAVGVFVVVALAVGATVAVIVVGRQGTASGDGDASAPVTAIYGFQVAGGL